MPHIRRAAFLTFVMLSMPLCAQASISWTPGFAEALELARKDNRPVFVAINMDRERANDEMVREVYKDPTLVDLSKHSVNLFCSQDSHGGTCTRVAGSLHCEDHQKAEIAVRERILGIKAGEAVIAPQHLFLAPDGAVISSVAYRVTKAELEWMWVAAIKKVDANANVQATPRAKAPHELVVGEKLRGDATEKPPSKEDIDAALKELKKTKRGMKMPDHQTLQMLARSSEPEAIQFAENALRAVPDQRKVEILNQIGRNSPKEWWQLVATYIDFRTVEVRKAAIVALERFAEPKSLPTLQGQLTKETDGYLKGRLLRAMAAVAPTNKTVAGELLKYCKTDKDELVRAQACIAVAAVEDKAMATALVNLGLQDKSAKVRGGAAYAIATRRDKENLPALAIATKAETEETALALLEAARLAVEKNGKLDAFREFLRKDIGDG